MLKLFLATAGLLGSHGLLRVAPLPARLRSLLAQIQAALVLGAWIVIMLASGFGWAQ